jgi:hypothetical protein
MKTFISKTIIFILPVIVIFLLGIVLPTTPRASKSLLMASVNKNLLLQNTLSPRIIFVGGSNISFGLNSQMIKDSLLLNPINTAIHASIGIKFMIDNTIDFIQEGDIVVLVPEYSHFYKSLNFGSEELLRTILDVDLIKLKYLNVYQMLNIIPFIPKYSLTKFKLSEYIHIKENGVYSVSSFNQFGDAYKHWGMQQQDFSPYGPIKGEFNYELIKYFEKFSFAIKEKGGVLLVSFPGFQEISFNNSKEQILKVEQELLNSNLLIIGSPKRYKMPDSLMFNTPYHLTKSGVYYRTKLIIDDIKKARTHIAQYSQ